MIKKNWPFLVFLAIFFSALFYKIVFHMTPFYDWDESLYMQTGREMIEKKFFLFPLWQGKIWFDKPPLVPFVYALVAKIFFFVPPEISARLFTVFVALVVLTFAYILYKRVIKNSPLTTVIVFLTATTPIFLQRSQVVNLDVFLLLGWLGYLLFFDKFWLSLFFLFIAVFSKSLIGFYPPFILFLYNLYLFFTKEINLKKLKPILVKIFVHVVILLSWFVLMYLKYGNIFWKMHIVESHFKRITSSIEFHFGERLFYLNLIKDQFGLFFYSALIGLLIIAIQYFQKKITSKILLISLYLLPWFIFLNATKTKIFWYLFATIPQFAFLAFYPLTVFKNKKIIFHILIFVSFGFIFYQAVFKQRFFSTFYSKYDSVYYLAKAAKKNCDQLSILIDKKTRNDFETLDKLGLLITTTKWWGNHPAILYYFGKKTNIIFDKNEFIKHLNNSNCIVVDNEDTEIDLKTFKLVEKFDSIGLYRRLTQ